VFARLDISAYSQRFSAGSALVYGSWFIRGQAVAQIVQGIIWLPMISL
jgi:hypothetical protein